MLVEATGDRVPVENNTTLIEVAGNPSLLVFARDTASRKRLERDFAHAQRLGALGELTGGVAHDFNNALQVLGGSFEVLQRDEGGGSNTDAYRAAKSALEQPSGLVKQLLAFSRKQELEKQGSILWQKWIVRRHFFSKLLAITSWQPSLSIERLGWRLISMCLTRQ